MYYYAKKDKTEFSVTLEQLRNKLGDQSIPAETTDIGEWVAYVGKDCPQIEWYESAREIYPVDGVMTWEVSRLPDDVIARIEEQRRIGLPIANRLKRDEALRNYVDTMNPMRWETLSEVEKSEWRAFRQALLDIPQQAGFPDNIEWPNLPSFIAK